MSSILFLFDCSINYYLLKQEFSKNNTAYTFRGLRNVVYVQELSFYFFRNHLNLRSMERDTLNYNIVCYVGKNK